MRALVISGGGSKGAFAGGVAQFLIQEAKHEYDLFVGTSTGSLLITHLALNKLDKIKDIYSSVNQHSIFNNCPFIIKKKHGVERIAINHWNVFKNFIKGKKTFGESENLRELIRESITEKEFTALKNSNTDVIVTVSNLSLNQVEYKSINECTYEEFCDWIWISSNYVPFMSLVKRNGCEYADGGLGSLVPIEEALKRGATELDVVVLRTEVNYLNRMPVRSPFELITTSFEFMLDRIENQNVRVGKLVANQKDAIINFYYTPTVLTTNSLIFNKERMTLWWKRGYLYAKNKNEETSPIDPEHSE
ncbi:patatin-like phospholipase family protein [Flagellimonas meridianipacifica]|uniref:Patatin-like phospholipase n=1 Tax=Flagellimonas meridianipacifica TaxID=1080225 RepID=A0A2T0MB76_9FLAO|nr:patatin-like phospholipase family protein [Allomuricauda pacifica]PRX54725.1 patatin-like phospholipase [Allomuricauda pacifica]